MDKDYPLWVGWMDLKAGRWEHGRIMKVIDRNSSILGVQVDSGSIRRITLSLLHKMQFFLYQRPSTSWSPLYPSNYGTQEGRSVFLEEITFEIDDQEKADEEYAFTKKNLFCEVTSKIRYDAVVPVYHMDLPRHVVFSQVMHSKKMYDVLKDNDLLSAE